MLPEFIKVDTKTQENSDDAAMPDNNVAMPKPTPNMLYGLAGKIGLAATENSEANPYAVALHFLTMLSAECGRDICLPIADTKHHPRLFCLHVGRSSKGRKGEAMSMPKRIRRKIDTLCKGDMLLGQYHTGGLSSREGLTVFIHDGMNTGQKNEIAPIDDKRLFIIESEFANVLHQAKRDGNTLSAALRDVWDGESLKPATKTARVWASDPHIALWANITPGELLELIMSRELSNGFANRFLIFWAERQKLVAYPKPVPETVITSFGASTMAIIKWALGDYPRAQDTRQASLSEEAEKLYSTLYFVMAKESNTPQIDAILARRATNLLRLALVYAIADKTLVIEKHHIEAAYSWIVYCSVSVKYIFSSLNNEHELADIKEAADKIAKFLKSKDSATRTQIIAECFSGHTLIKTIDGALVDMLSSTPPKIELTVIPRADGKTGRDKKIYTLAKLAKLAKIEAQCSIEANDNQCEISEVCEVSFLYDDKLNLTSQTSQHKITNKNPAIPQTSQTSQTSPKKIETSDKVRI